jgi:cbb3-type cytochrome oxidase maturation protein
VNIILVLIPLTLVLVIFAGWGFFWAVGTGQFDDLDSPAWDVLVDDDAKPACTTPPATGNANGAVTDGTSQEPR